jgi:hypothetical protein
MVAGRLSERELEVASLAALACPTKPWPISVAHLGAHRGEPSVQPAEQARSRQPDPGKATELTPSEPRGGGAGCLTNREVAPALLVSPETIEANRARIH